MKRIGILTYHRSFNYGALMQSYSLSTRIAKDFPEAKVELIDYCSKKVYLMYNENFKNYVELINETEGFRQKLTFLRRMISCFVNKKDKDEEKKLMNLFEKQLLDMNLSDFKIISDDENIVFDKIKNKYDILIVGSDAVWNWQIRKFPNAYFLNDNLGAVKMSYAASSYGQDYKAISSAQKAYIREAWMDFDYLGVRDDATENFVKYVDSSLIPHHNCDPTVILDMNELNVDMDNLRKMLEDKGIDLSKPVIGLMGDEWLGKIAREIVGDKFQIVAIFKKNKYADVFLEELSPFQWSRVFSFFSVTFTRYFHGNLLSLKNEVPTIVIEENSEYHKKYTSKIRDFMKRVNLLDFCYSVSDIPKCNQEIKTKIKSWISDNTEVSNRIKAGIEREKQSYCEFKEELNKILSEN